MYRPFRSRGQFWGDAVMLWEVAGRVGTNVFTPDLDLGA